MGAAGGVVGPGEGGEEPFHAGWVEGHIDLDGGMAGDGGRNAGARGFKIVGLSGGAGLLDDFVDHALEFVAGEARRRGFDGDGMRAKGLGLATVAIELSGEGGEDDHLLGEQVDEHGHEEALTLDALGLALAEDFFEKNALMSNVLIDDPEAFVVGSEDEGFAELAERFEGGEGS